LEFVSVLVSSTYLQHHALPALRLSFSSILRPHPSSALFPYTTLFRSERGVPVFALKVGRTERSKAMVTAHSGALAGERARVRGQDRKSTRLNSSHVSISYAVFCLKKKKNDNNDKHFRVDELMNDLV